jgi:MFS superfamily sulfate permease-like transporter
LLTDLLTGVIIGIVTGLFFVMRSNFKTAVFVVHDNNKFLFRLRKDVSFLNKPIIKNKLEEIPENAYVLVDTTRADFIDKDVVEVIEDFMKHASLKNIRVDLKTSGQRNQGFQQQMKSQGTKDNIVAMHV